MSAEDIKMNGNPPSGEYITLKKSTVKTLIVIAAAVVVGGLGAWFVNSFGVLSFSVRVGGKFAVFNFIVDYVLYAVSAVAAVLAVSVILFRFVRFSYKVFVPVSAVASLLIGATVVHDYLTTMLSTEDMPMLKNIDTTGGVILVFSLIGVAVAICVFLLSLSFGRVIKKLAVK